MRNSCSFRICCPKTENSPFPLSCLRIRVRLETGITCSTSAAPLRHDANETCGLWIPHFDFLQRPSLRTLLPPISRFSLPEFLSFNTVSFHRSWIYAESHWPTMLVASDSPSSHPVSWSGPQIQQLVQNPSHGTARALRHDLQHPALSVTMHNRCHKAFIYFGSVALSFR